MANIIEKRISTDYFERPTPLDYDEIPVLSNKDYEDRIGALWAMPQTQDYQTIIIYGDREHFSNVHYFTSYDPRWEETLLILKRNQVPKLLVGNEGIGYVKKVPIEIDVELFQSFSLMGQPNDKSRALREILEESLGDVVGAIGLVGFKKYEESLFENVGPVSDIPHYILEVLFQIKDRSRFKNATDVMSDCEYGLKHHISAKEAVIFESIGTRVSRGVYHALKHLKPGLREVEAGLNCLLDGTPLNMHPNVNFGDKNVSYGLNSPTEQQKLEYGMPVGIGYGGRGCLVHKSGMYIRDAKDIPKGRENYVEDFLKPYFSSVAHWYEMMQIDTCFGDIYEMVDRELGLEKFGCTLNPGHLGHTDEWTNSPFYKNSTVKVRSGLAIQCDYTVTWSDPYMTAHVEDGLIIADEKLRAEIKSISPSCFKRISNRRDFIIDVLGITLAEEVLPMSDLALVCFPYMADLSIVLAKG